MKFKLIFTFLAFSCRPAPMSPLTPAEDYPPSSIGNGSATREEVKNTPQTLSNDPLESLARYMQYAHPGKKAQSCYSNFSLDGKEFSEGNPEKKCETDCRRLEAATIAKACSGNQKIRYQLVYLGKVIWNGTETCASFYEKHKEDVNGPDICNY